MKNTKRFSRIIVVVLALTMLMSSVVMAAPVSDTQTEAPQAKSVAYYRGILLQLFDADDYAKLYPEVAALYNFDEDLLFEHFLRYGIYNALRSNDMIPGWSAELFTNIIRVFIGEQYGKDAAVLLAEFAKEPANTYYVNRLDTIVTSMAATGLPPVEITVAPAASAPVVEESAPSQPSGGPGGSGGGPTRTVIYLSANDFITSSTIASPYIIEALTDYILDTNYEDDVNITVKSGGRLIFGSNGNENIYFENTSKITVEDGGEIYNTTNNLKVYNGAQIINNGYFLNTGELKLYGTLTNNSLVQNGTESDQGIITTSSYAVINNHSVIDTTNGFIDNSGTINQNTGCYIQGVEDNSTESRTDASVTVTTTGTGTVVTDTNITNKDLCGENYQ